MKSNNHKPNDLAFSLIIPTLNERGNIQPLLEQLRSVLKDLDYEIIVVDDDSPDGTPEFVEEYSKKHPSVRLIRRTVRNGLSAAVLDGFQQATGQWLGVMDADLSHDTAILPALIHAVEEGNEMAVGSRRVPGGGADHWPWFRRLFSSVATGAAKMWLGVPINDPMSGYFVVTREAYKRAVSSCNPKGYKILLEILTRAKIKDFKEIPFVFKDRTQGQSKLTTSVALQFLSMLWDLRMYSPLLRRFKPR